MHNFAAGPTALPSSTIHATIHSLQTSTPTPLEISHRSSQFLTTLTNASAHVRRLLKIENSHQIIWMQGGGTGGFAAVPLNMGKRKGRYIINGTWSQKAYEEAKLLGKEPIEEWKEIAKFPDKNELQSDLRNDDNIQSGQDDEYLYYCDNETIHGVEAPPTAKLPFKHRNIVADMSSNLFSRPVDVSKYAVIFATAQKNFGPAGVTLYIIRNDLIKPSEGGVPSILDWHKNKDSLYNTSPVFSIFVCELVLRDLQMDDINGEKSGKVYKLIERYPQVYKANIAEPKWRSRMNVCFGCTDEAKFLALAKEADMIGLEGHRSVGGIRVSCYNAITMESIDAVCGLMRTFAESKMAMKA